MAAIAAQFEGSMYDPSAAIMHPLDWRRLVQQRWKDRGVRRMPRKVKLRMIGRLR